MENYAADSIEEAVALAERFREEGRYNLFRGQRENWPVVPTLARLNEEEVAAAHERLKLFFSWLEEQPELAVLADREDPTIVDQKFAIAQHYGLPTLFCDFTLEPRVAGFFASSRDESEGGTSVLVCCNSEDLLSCCEQTFFPEMRLPEVLRITVPNLWRLEAQAGVFLFLSAPNFESWYDFDRITFPRGSYKEIAAEDVFPARRSRLEVLIDQYFRYELEVANHDALMGNRDLYVSVAPGAEKMMQACLVDGDPGPHDSWIEASKEWGAYHVEKWSPGSGTTRLHICDDLRGAPADVGEEVRERVLKFLGERERARREAVSLSSGTPEFTGFMERAQMLWDGVRTFPYSDEEIALALANMSILGTSLLHVSEPAGWSRPNEHVARVLWKEPLQVEFGRRGAPAAVAYVDESALMNALRPDFSDLLKPEHRNLAAHAVNVVNVVPIPSRAFVFRSFASSFVTQVVPSQVILFRSNAHYFSPLQLETFGNP